MDFILLHYVKEKLDFSRDYGHTYLKSQRPAFFFMIDQLRLIYPGCTIHVLTNTDMDVPGCVIHRGDFGSNHTAKFEIYGLLDRPSMYLDCDIILYRQFSEKELSTPHAFKLFAVSQILNLNDISTQPVESKHYKLYNAGVVWIARPSHKVTDELKSMDKEFFGDKNQIKSKGFWPYNDEYSISLMLDQKGIEFDISRTVNNLNHWHDDTQSRHFTGLAHKGDFLSEVLNRKKVHL